LGVTDEARIITLAAPPYSIVHTNKAWSELTGYKFADVSGKSCGFLQGPQTTDAALEVLRTAIRVGEPVTVKLVNYARDGTPFYNTIECDMVQGGTHYYATIRGEPADDIEPMEPSGLPVSGQVGPVNYASRQAHTRVKRTHGVVKLTDVLANETDPIVLCSKEYPHVITHPNPAWCEMCGYTLEEVEGLTNSILTGSETDPEIIEALLACVRRHEPSVHTVVNYKKDGERFVNQVKVAPVYDENDELAAFMSMLREVDQ
jgi:PAS domain S-box-containing protein